MVTQGSIKVNAPEGHIGAETKCSLRNLAVSVTLRTQRHLLRHFFYSSPYGVAVAHTELDIRPQIHQLGVYTATQSICID